MNNTISLTEEENKKIDDYLKEIRWRFRTDWTIGFDRNNYQDFKSCVTALDERVLIDPLNKILDHMVKNYVGSFHLFLDMGCGPADMQWEGWLGTVWRFGDKYQAHCNYFNNGQLLRSHWFVFELNDGPQEDCKGWERREKEN